MSEEKTTVIVTENVDVLDIHIKVPKKQLFWMSENQHEMLALSQNRPSRDSLLSILSLIWHIIYKGESNG